MTRPIQARAILAAAALMLASFLVTPPHVVAQTPPPAPSTGLVAVAALAPLLPVPEGWTQTRTGGNRFDLGSECAYASADEVLMKDQMKVRLTIADSGRNADSLRVLAPLVMTFPDDYIGTLAKDTTIIRLKFNGVPAASRWDGEKNEGEFTAVIDGRFVVQAEGTNVDGLDTLKKLVGQVNFKGLAALK